MQVEQPVEGEHGRNGGVGADVGHHDGHVGHPEVHAEAAGEGAQEVEQPDDPIAVLHPDRPAEGDEDEHVDHYVSAEVR